MNGDGDDGDRLDQDRLNEVYWWKKNTGEPTVDAVSKLANLPDKVKALEDFRAKIEPFINRLLLLDFKVGLVWAAGGVVLTLIVGAIFKALGAR